MIMGYNKISHPMSPQLIAIGFIVHHVIIQQQPLVKVYDSILLSIDETTKQILYKRFPSNTHIKVVRKRQKQVVEKHRAIAFATS